MEGGPVWGGVGCGFFRGDGLRFEGHCERVARFKFRGCGIESKVKGRDRVLNKGLFGCSDGCLVRRK